jgi:hypothetical protein
MSRIAENEVMILLPGKELLRRYMAVWWADFRLGEHKIKR